MLKSVARVLLIIPILYGCDISPYSQGKIHLPEHDGLSNDQKIALFGVGTDKISATGMAALARLYANQKQYDRALKSIEQAILEDPMNSDYHTLKANYVFELGNLSVAYSEALTAYQLGTKSLQQSLNLTKMAVALSEFSIVNNIIDSLVIAYPEDPQVLYLASRKYEKTGNTSKALRYFRKVMQLDPNNRDNIFYFANFLYMNNRPAEASQVLLKLAIDLRTRRYYTLAGDIFSSLNELDSAATFYKNALALEVDSVLYSKILDLYSQTKNSDSIIAVAGEAIEHYPDNQEYLHLLARSLDRRYRYDEALPYYLTLYKMDTLDTLVASELAYLQRKIRYLQRKKEEELKEGQLIPVERVTLPSLDSIRRD